MPSLRDRTFSADRSGRDHAGGIWRPRADRPPGGLPRGPLFGAGRLCRGRRIDRGGGRARAQGRGRRGCDGRALYRQPALAVSVAADDRLHRQRRRRRADAGLDRIGGRDIGQAQVGRVHVRIAILDKIIVLMNVAGMTYDTEIWLVTNHGIEDSSDRQGIVYNNYARYRHVKYPDRPLQILGWLISRWPDH